jgi:hypothetical protein
MEDISNWLYIVAAVVYFLIQLRGAKKKAPAPNTPQEQNRTPEPAPRTITFEDVLKEILEERKTPPPAPQPAPSPVSKPIEVKREMRKPQLTQAPEKRSLKPSKSVAYKDEEGKSLEVLESSTGLPVEYKRGSLFNQFAQDEVKVNPYSELLKNPKTLRQAVITAEILKPKFDQ